MTTAIEPYTLLRAALALFEKSPVDLNPEQLARVETQARNEFTLESRVLSSLESAAVIVPDKELNLAFAQVRGRFETQDQFEAVLAANSLTVEALQSALFRQCKVTEVGFHLIQCLKISHAQTMSLKTATPKIRQLMEERQRQICQKTWLASLPKVSESHDQRN